MYIQHANAYNPVSINNYDTHWNYVYSPWFYNRSFRVVHPGYIPRMLKSLARPRVWSGTEKVGGKGSEIEPRACGRHELFSLIASRTYCGCVGKRTTKQIVREEEDSHPGYVLNVKSHIPCKATFDRKCIPVKSKRSEERGHGIYYPRENSLGDSEKVFGCLFHTGSGNRFKRYSRC